MVVIEGVSPYVLAKSELVKPDNFNGNGCRFRRRNQANDRLWSYLHGFDTVVVTCGGIVWLVDLIQKGSWVDAADLQIDTDYISKL
jgi:hypothetical protein